MYMLHGMPQTACHHCGQTIAEGQERATAIIIGIPKNFCKFEGDDPQYSCYNQWRVQRAGTFRCR